MNYFSGKMVDHPRRYWGSRNIHKSTKVTNKTTTANSWNLKKRDETKEEILMRLFPIQYKSHYDRISSKYLKDPSCLYFSCRILFAFLLVFDILCFLEEKRKIKFRWTSSSFDLVAWDDEDERKKNKIFVPILYIRYIDFHVSTVSKSIYLFCSNSWITMKIMITLVT